MPSVAKSIINPPEEYDRTSVTLKRSLWAKIETIRRAINATRSAAPTRLSRDELMGEMLEYCTAEMAAEWLRKGASLSDTAEKEQ